MTKFLHVEFDDDAYERLMRNMTAKEKVEYNRVMAKNVDVLTRSFRAKIEAQLQELGTREPDDISCFPLSKIGLFVQKLPGIMNLKQQ